MTGNGVHAIVAGTAATKGVHDPDDSAIIADGHGFPLDAAVCRIFLLVVFCDATFIAVKLCSSFAVPLPGMGGEDRVHEL